MEGYKRTSGCNCCCCQCFAQRTEEGWKCSMNSNANTNSSLCKECCDECQCEKKQCKCLSSIDGDEKCCDCKQGCCKA